jgi:ubiquitin carboxyl-terminal hydrolase 14
MRKVKFPVEYDALDLVTPELKEQLQPVARRLKEIARDRAERAKVRKRTKAATSSKKDDPSLSPTSLAPPPIPAPVVAPVEGGDIEMASAPPPEVPEEQPTQAGGELEPEVNYRRRELAELEGLVSPEIKADVGASVSGLYELVAIVTHKGAAADAGHYIGFVKKSVFAKVDPENPEAAEADDDWYKFDDDKVSVFPAEKLATLDGGGQDASAYVLLYRSKPLA